MSDAISIIREAILGTIGLGGVLRFDALYAGSFETEDNRPDLPAISGAINHAFPQEQAEIIMATVTMKLGNTPQASMPAAQPAQKGKTTVPAFDNHESSNQVGTPAFMKYFNADPNVVQDIVSEARRIRLAMGKTIVMPAGLPAESTADLFIAGSKAPAEKAVEIPRASPQVTTINRPTVPEPVKSPTVTAVSKPGPVAKQVSEIDREIEQFAYGHTAYSSIDIIDFIRSMKDKGYSFEDCIVLEKIYVTIEERKKEAQYTIEKEVEGIFKGAQAPFEPEIIGLIEHLKETGLVFEEVDVRRMIRVAALRRAQESL
jgi:hypothetical protein